MIDMRVFYSKTGRMKYISHLDLYRCMQRAFKRSKIPVWYTEGFNPHIYLTFALPLSLGYESLCESVDFRLTEPMEPEEIKERLNAVLMPGLTVIQVAPPVCKPTQIAWAEFEVRIALPQTQYEMFADQFLQFCQRSEIIVSKKTKKGEKQVDIRPMIQPPKLMRTQEGIQLFLRLAAGVSQNLNPSLLLDRFFEEIPMECEIISVTRTAVLKENGENFA